MRGKRLTICLGDSDRWQHHALHLEILEVLRKAGCGGATVTRGIAGFGAHAFIKSADIEVLSGDLPIVITAVDTEERIEAVVPKIAAMMAGGVMTVDETDIRYYAAAFRGGLPDVAVGTLMTRNPDIVHRDTTIAEVVARLLERDHTALPVVDADHRFVGMVDEADLVEHSLAGIDLDLHRAAGPEAVREHLAKLRAAGAIVDSAISRSPTVTAATPLGDAAHVMHTNKLKRLPVVDEAGRLVGMLGQVDILRSAATGHARRAGSQVRALPQEHRTVASIMDREVPTVTAATPIIDALDRLLDSDVKRVIVVDADQRPIGIITDADLVQRMDPEDRPGLLTVIKSGWSEEARTRVRRARAQRAADLMTKPVVTIAAGAPVIDALALTATKHIKRLPVVDDAGRLVGLVSRPALLAACLDVGPT
ncbi:MAG TPA: DUF190 domain-containing protein [Kofleriaceae bacterium]|nr:DUF190 domain-containing protein [Kofleriaceae bacterium]